MHDIARQGAIQQHKFAACTWAKVGADMCKFQGRTLLVVADYFNNFNEVDGLQSVTTGGVCKATFACYGSPDTLVMDNGPQF